MEKLFLIVVLALSYMGLSAQSVDDWFPNRTKVNFKDSTNFVKTPLINGVDTAATLRDVRAVGGGGSIDMSLVRVEIGDSINALRPFIIYVVDTADMLAPYVREVEVTAITDLKLDIADTTNMLSKYIRIADTLDMLDPYLLEINAADTYAPLASPTFTGTVTLPTATSIGDVSSTEIGYVNGVTSNIQTQLNSKVNISDTTSMLAPYILDSKVQSDIHDTITARLAGGTVGVALADSNVYNGGYATPTWVKANAGGGTSIYEEYDYYIEESGGTVYARPSPNTSLTAYSNAAFHTTFNNAITALNTAGGGTILIKGGSYSITSRLSIRNVSNIDIIGLGEVLITKTANDSNFPYYFSIVLDGTLSNVKIENIIFANSQTEAVAQNEGYIYIRSATGLVLDADSIEISRCGFRRAEINMRAIQVLATLANSDLNHFFIHDCWFDDIYNMAIEILNQEDTYAALTKLKNISICDNYFYSTGSQSISVVGGTQGLVIKGNTGIEVGGSMIEVANTRDVIISENIMNNTSVEGQFLITTTSLFTTLYTGNIRIENNIAHCYNPSPDGYSVTGLWIRKADTVDIVGNTIYAELNEVNESHYVNVVDNRLITTGRNAIKYSGASTNGYIADNYLDNTQAFGGINSGTIYFVNAGTTNNVANDNIIYSTDGDNIIEAGSASGNAWEGNWDQANSTFITNQGDGGAVQYTEGGVTAVDIGAADLTTTGSVTSASVSTEVLQVGDATSSTILSLDSLSTDGTTYSLYDGATQLAPAIPASGQGELSDYVPLLVDTIPLFVFGGGGGNTGDTTVFTTSTIYGTFFNAGSDTLVVTELRACMTPVDGSDTLDVDILWDVNLNDASPTKLNTTPLPVNSSTTGTVDTVFDDAKIPPGVWVWCETPAVIVGRKPTLLIVQLSGYKIPTY